jgi:peptidoglycan/xylan/chitin deacetylase (PgdA/CDA1 family)
MWFTTSWDDGHPLDRRLADLLARHGIRGTFYCPQRNRDGLPVMQPADLRALDGPFEIGSHTLDHAYANRVPAPEWARLVVQGKAQLEDTLGHAVEGFCYPGGKRVIGSRAAVAAAGFRYARTTESFCQDVGRDPLQLPTTLQFHPHPRSVLLRNLVSGGRWGRRLALASVCLAEADFESRLTRALQVCLTRGSGFHLWGHSWEIDRNGLWPLLDRFFGRVATQVPADSRLSNAGMLRHLGLLA